MIHPYSRLKLLWDAIIMIIITYYCFYVPYQFSFHVEVEGSVLLIEKLIGVIFFVDIISFFYTGYYEDGVLIIAPAKIAKRYLNRRFIVDLLSSLPFYIIYRSYPESYILEGLSALFFLRLFRVSVAFKNFRHYLDINPSVFRIVTLFYFIGTYSHWLACIWYRIGVVGHVNNHDNWVKTAELIDLPTLNHYLHSIYWVITTMTTVGYGDITPQNNLEMIFTIMVMIIGVSSYAYIIGNLSTMIANIDSTSVLLNKQFQGVDDCLRKNKSPERVRKQVKAYFNYLKDTKRTLSGLSPLDILPSSFKTDIFSHIHEQSIDKVDLFKNMPQGGIRSIMTLLREEIYLPNQYLIRQGELGTDMYFLTKGSVKVVMDNKVMAILKEGDYFGEVALIKNVKRTASVLSTEYCAVYVLNKQDFNEILSIYPEFAEEIKQRAANYSKEYESEDL